MVEELRRQLFVAEPPFDSVRTEGAHVTARLAFGETLDDTLTFPVNWLRLVRVTVAVPESPTLRVTELGVDMLKSMTVTVIVVVWCVSESLVPVTVTV